jgi:hypothetical protein
VLGWPLVRLLQDLLSLSAYLFLASTLLSSRLFFSTEIYKGVTLYRNNVAMEKGSRLLTFGAAIILSGIFVTAASLGGQVVGICQVSLT